MPQLFDYPLAIIDVETTGMSHLHGGVIDVGLIRVEHGQVVHTYQQLINPGSPIPAFITQLTGITNDELESAPSFADIATELRGLIDGCIFVAHNARFDYAFIKEEFRRCGIKFNPKTFCTVKLSRALYPQHRHHKLDALIERFNIPVEARHRAFGDAQATWEALQHMINQGSPQSLEYNVKQQLRQPTLPPQIAKPVIDQLPDGPGVYRFYNASGGLLYVGKSINIKTRILSHFSDDVRSAKELKLASEVADIQTQSTAGELGALLLESQLIKSQMPIYNQQLRRKTELVLAIQQTSDQGYPIITTQRHQAIDPTKLDQVMAVFRSEREAKEVLTGLAKKYRLCQKLMGLERGSGPCFYYHLKQCDGACIGKELPISYQLKLDQAFTKLRLSRWEFDGPILVTETASDGSAADQFVLNQWCLVGVMHQQDQAFTWQANDQSFDLDTYKILRSYLAKVANHRTIQVVSLQQMHQYQQLQVE